MQDIYIIIIVLYILFKISHKILYVCIDFLLEMASPCLTPRGMIRVAKFVVVSKYAVLGKKYLKNANNKTTVKYIKI